jgi:hypothetical protein
MANKTTIMTDFPKIKLSYETFVHKKVFDANVVLAIPAGKKCFAWFTTKNEKNVCYILELGENKQIEKYHMVTACFHESLSIGTILYGTLFFHEKRRFFAMEDVMNYKGKNVVMLPYIEKLKLFETMFTADLSQASYSPSFVTFGLPLMSRDIESLLAQITPTQRIMYFQYRYFNKPTIYRVKPYVVMRTDMDMDTNTGVTTQHIQQAPQKQPNQQQPPQPQLQQQPQQQQVRYNNRHPQPTYERVFSIMADIQNDIYHLYEPSNKSLVGTAYIPDYKTSVMMNQLFRNIKENVNLDSLEESDTEEEFENDRADKFVYLDREYTMVCAYNNKFKKWVPLRVVVDKSTDMKK